jgi:hypothetical protein
MSASPELTVPTWRGDLEGRVEILDSHGGDVNERTLRAASRRSAVMSSQDSCFSSDQGEATLHPGPPPASFATMIDSETSAAHRKRRSILEVSWSDRSISSKGGDTGGTSGRRSKEGAWIVSVGLEPIGEKERSKMSITSKEADACQVVDWIKRSIVIYASSESASDSLRQHSSFS